MALVMEAKKSMVWNVEYFRVNEMKWMCDESFLDMLLGDSVNCLGQIANVLGRHSCHGDSSIFR